MAELEAGPYYSLSHYLLCDEYSQHIQHHACCVHVHALPISSEVVISTTSLWHSVGRGLEAAEYFQS